MSPTTVSFVIHSLLCVCSLYIFLAKQRERKSSTAGGGAAQVCANHTINSMKRGTIFNFFSFD